MLRRGLRPSASSLAANWNADVGFLLSRRWLGFAVFVVALSIAFYFLGQWQFHRAEDRSARNDRVRAALAADPIDLSQLEPAASAEWTRVSATGTFDPSHVVTVRYMARDGAPGVDVVAPFRMTDSDAILVDLGWLSTDNSGAKPDSIPQPPVGEVTIEGWWRLDSNASEKATVPVDDQVRAIDSRVWETPYELQPGWLHLQSPAVDGLVAEPVPDLGGGPHLAYGLQWWFFAILAVFGFFWFARAEKKIERADAQAKETSSA